jgi:hypothetical protein
MIVPDSKTGAERINYIMYNANYFFDSLSFNIDSVTMLGSMGDGYLIKISAKTDCESEPTEPTEPTESAAPNAEAQKAMAAAVRTSSYASPTGESMTRIAANEGGAAIDATTGIVPAGAKFTSSQLSSGATYDNAANIVAARIGANTHFAVFEMDLTDNNNMAIHQLDGMINVTLPIPEGMTPSDGNILAVYRIEDDGTMTRCDTATANGFLTFATNHFSTYVMVEEPASGASAGTKATSPKTAESAANMILVMIAAMSLAGAAVVSKKRYNG